MTRRALLLGLLFSFFVSFWVRQSEIVVLATQITESVPTIPSLAVLVVLLVVNSVLRKVPRAVPLTRAELLVVFLFVGVSSMVMGIGIVQFLISLMAAPFYKKEGIALQPHFPPWLFPTSTEAMRQIYERAPDGRVPWEIWALPGLLWCGFFVAVAATLACLMAFFHRSWAEEEKLAFPLLTLPLELAQPGGRFFRSPVMWAGFAVSGLYNGVNIVHALVPSFPELGKQISLDPLLSVAPWNAAAPLALHLRPELMGLGYLVSTDISLTLWLSVGVRKLAAVLGLSMGYEPQGLYPMEQGIGAYVALALVLIVQARKHLRAVADQKPWLLLGLCGSAAASVGFAVVAGLTLWVALFYFALIFLVALVYGRLRAQTGVPMVWLFPYYQTKQILFFTLGSAPLAATGPKSLAVWTLFTVLTRGYFQSVCGYQIEGLEVARREGFSGRRMSGVLLLAVAVGFGLGWYQHLVPYHQFGALHLRGEIWGGWIGPQESRQAVSLLNGSYLPRDDNKVAASVAGAVIVALLSALRLGFAAFPVHPLGYAMASCFGETMWFSFFVVWLVKGLMLRYGGMMLYRKTVPFFLGLALGHFFVAGVFWGLVGAFSGEAVQGYPVFFG